MSQAWSVVRMLARAPAGARAAGLAERFLPREVRRARLHGAELLLDLGQRTHRRIFLGIYERRELEAVRRLLPAGGVLVDVGANAGLFTVAAAPRASRVVAVEPCPAVLPLLRANVAPFPHVTVVEAAASAEEGFATLAAPSETAHATLTGSEGAPGVRVRTVSLAAELDRLEIPRLDLVKIDAEGWEPVVLADLRQRLVADRPVLLCELDPVLLSRTGTTPAAVAATLAALGYRPLRVGRRGPAPVQPAHAAGSVLFVPGQ